MPLKYFKCPDGGIIDTQECIANNGCRMGERCISRPVLQQMAKTRIWDGRPSVTQLLVGTYEAFLKIKEDYIEDPDSLVFSLQGTTVHNKLDTASGEGLLTEDDIGRLEGDDGVTGLPDLITDEFGIVTLLDYKNSGSFKVAKALGMEYTLEESPTEVYKQRAYVKDPSGKTITREKGQPKLIKVWKVNPLKQDCFEWVMQTNKYRVMVKQRKNMTIDRLQIQVMVRDGGTMQAKDRGLFRRSYLMDIPILPDEEVEAYFSKKQADLLEALRIGDWHEQCSVSETWNGRKCAEYCSVKDFCKWMKKSQNTTPAEND